MKPTNTKHENQTPPFSGGSNGMNLTVLASGSRTMNMIWGI